MINVMLDEVTQEGTGRRYVNIRLTDTRPDGRTFRVSVRAQDIDAVIEEMRRLAPLLHEKQGEIWREIDERRERREHVDQRRQREGLPVPLVETVRPLQKRT